MHILHVVQLYHEASGAARFFREIGERLVRDGHRVTVIASDAFDLEHLWMRGKRQISGGDHGGVHVIRLPIWRLPGPPISYPILRRLMLELGRLPRTTPLLRHLAQLTPRLAGLRQTLAHPRLADIQLVHTTNITLDFAILPVLAWARQRQIAHLCTPFVHLGEPGSNTLARYYSMPHMLELLRQSNGVITMTELERAFLSARGVPPERMTTVGVGVNLADVQGGDAVTFRAQHQIEGPIVLSLGAAAFDKGTIHTVEALRRLWAEGRQVTWVQVGPQLDHFLAHMAQLSPAERARTRLLGFVDEQQRRDALAACDLMAMPSRTDSFGIAYLEAWCYQKPVIGARAGGVPEVVRDREGGRLVEFGAVDQLQAVIADLLDNPAQAAHYGQQGYARLLRELTWEHKYRLAKTAYERATARS